MATQFGTDLQLGGQTSITGYIVVSEVADKEIYNPEDIDDATGTLTTKIVYGTHPTLKLELICLSGNSGAEFPQGAMCTATGLTAYWVRSCTVTETKSATRISVDMINQGIS
jgi:hypothetical protein